jgi:hypothetical protein
VTTDWHWILIAMSGVAIAAACGLRAFLPLLLLGVAARAGWVELVPQAAWLASDLALGALAVATVVELAADKIPVVDHVLDGVATVLRPAAAWLGAYALLAHWPAPWGQILAIVLGTLALVVHGVKAKLRLGSTTLTLGQANPVLSVAEDVAAAAGVAIAVLAPLLAILILATIAVAVVAVLRRPRVRRASPEAPAP